MPKKLAAPPSPKSTISEARMRQDMIEVLADIHNREATEIAAIIGKAGEGDLFISPYSVALAGILESKWGCGPLMSEEKLKPGEVSSFRSIQALFKKSIGIHEPLEDTCKP